MEPFFGPSVKKGKARARRQPRPPAYRNAAIGTVHRLARASLSPCGPSPLPRSSPRIPPVVPLPPGLEVLGGGYGGTSTRVAVGARASWAPECWFWGGVRAKLFAH